ncbi:hypothetical protein QYE76_003604 [Lolium multiflorum]|uniref:CCHC-type domain-containing protein n=1 Tax=Lolium multiflorum TaxID=4521 RepID=A0AAD8RQJ2_LOLMU|nr:hypothetical protein QYE76_003604 [Lolium multiflorum]
MSDWFELKYENLPRYCFSCGLIGHSSTECLNPGDRDADGKLPYSADRLCAPDERKKKPNGAQSSSGSVPTSRGRSSYPMKDKPTQGANGSRAADKKQSDAEAEVSSPAKKRQTRTHAKAGTNGKDMSNNNNAGQDGSLMAGHKRKKVQEYRVRNLAILTAEKVHPIALVVRDAVSPQAIGEEQFNEAESNDSNKKRRSAGLRSADEAGAVEHPAKRNEALMLELSRVGVGRDNWQTLMAVESSSPLPPLSL